MVILEEELQPFELLILHLKVVTPADVCGRVIVDVAEEGVLMVAPAPLTMLQVPVSPDPGALAAMVTVPGHVAAILAPALATVADSVVKVTSW